MPKGLARMEQETIILHALQDKANTIQGVADKTGLPYYTVRRAINDFLREGVVKIVGTQDKHRIFSYNVESKRTEDKIPRLFDLLMKTSSKAIFILQAVGHEDKMKSVDAVMALPRHIAELMYSAMIASHDQEVNFRLERIRSQMQKDYLYAKNAAALYEQVLQEPRFWDPKFLRTMVDDPDYVAHEVQKVMDYYDENPRD